MAPQYPDEVNVFLVPHSRMKNLVGVYQDQMSAADFKSQGALEALLPLLEKTFTEFKTHEHIENRFIMERLKQRLKAVNATSSQAVCNCHGDNRLIEILNMVKDGYTCTDRMLFGVQLRKAISEFTEKFLPHMAEEEEVFQPLLVKYFAREELLALKEQVIQQHEIWKEKLLQQKESARILLELLDDDRMQQAFLSIAAPQPTDVDHLPSEMMVQIFSYLGPRDLTRCARVSKRWNVLAYSPELWRSVYPANWARGFHDFLHRDPYTLIADEMDDKMKFNSTGDDDEEEDSSSPLAAKETLFFEQFIRYGLMRMGDGVQRLVVAGSHHLSGTLLQSMLALCPNIRHLDASYTHITDISFKGLAALNACSQLEHLDLSGCRFLTDVGMERLGACFRTCSDRKGRDCCRKCPKPCEIEDFHGNPEEPSASMTKGPSPGLEHLNLSGCTSVTDHGLLSLLESSLRTSSLRFLDLSGCWRLSGSVLDSIAVRSATLKPEHLAYCDMIQDGPHPTQANGCQNLECPTRACCRSTGN